MHGMRKILEESEFFKLLAMKQKLSDDNFYSYNLSIQQDKSSLLPLLFRAIENPACCEDAYKSIIVTIKFQDNRLLNNRRTEESVDDPDIGKQELHRFLILMPFVNQQFLGYTDNADSSSRLRRSTTLFTNKKSIIQLLKKSLLSIGIDVKKNILKILDEI